MLPLLQQTHAAAERAKEHAAGLKLQTASPLRVGFVPDGEAVICRHPDCALTQLLGQARDGNALCPAIRHQADTPGRVADLVRAGRGVAVSTERAAPPEVLHRRPLVWRAAHDILLVAVAGRPSTRAADAFMKLARARAWQPSGTA